MEAQKEQLQATELTLAIDVLVAKAVFNFTNENKLYPNGFATLIVKTPFKNVPNNSETTPAMSVNIPLDELDIAPLINTLKEKFELTMRKNEIAPNTEAKEEEKK